MSSEESAYEDEEDPITGEVTQKLKGYLTKKLSWERTALTNLKSKLDRAHYRSLIPHAKALAKPRFEGDIGWERDLKKENQAWVCNIHLRNLGSEEWDNQKVCLRY